MTEFTWPDQRYMGRSADPRMQGLVKFSNPRGEIMPSAYTEGSDNAVALGAQIFPGFTSEYIPKRPPAVVEPPGLFSTQLEEEGGYGGLFGKIGDYGGKAMDWLGKQEVPQLMKMGLGIKEHFFDRPKMFDAYTSQIGSMNALRGKQMAAIDANISGMQRNEARKTAADLRFYNTQRPQGTAEKTEWTPSTYV